MELDIHDLSKITGICETSLITYLQGVFVSIPRIIKKTNPKRRGKFFFVVTESDIKKLKAYKLKRMRKY